MLGRTKSCRRCLRCMTPGGVDLTVNRWRRLYTVSGMLFTALFNVININIIHAHVKCEYSITFPAFASTAYFQLGRKPLLGVWPPYLHYNKTGHTASIQATSLTFRIWRVCYHSNQTRAPIANPPNSAQLGDTIPQSYIRVRAIVWERD